MVVRMGLWTCDCLNVKICTRQKDAPQADITQLGVNPSSHEIFNGGVAEVALDLEGIKVEYPSLVKQEKADNWLIQCCCNCHMYTHASRVGQGPSSLLVNMHLKHDPSEVEALSSRPEYSSVYKIILRRCDNSSQFIPQDSEAYRSVEVALRDVRHRLNTFLLEEEENTEVRIREYEASQRATLSEVQNKARREQHAMEKAIISAVSLKGSNQQPSSHDNSHESPDMFDGPQMPLDHRLSKSKRTSKGKKISQLSQSLQPRTVPDEIQDDVLFDMDNFQDGGDHPFYESDEDETDASSAGDDSSVPQSAAQLYSSSVPISVPMWGTSGGSVGSRGRRRDTLEEEEEEAPPTEDIAASIKALARSVHVDGTEIFGELPQSRRRINMSDVGL